jgi:hypothetical protein
MNKTFPAILRETSARFVVDTKRGVASIAAVKNLKAGSEVLVPYGREYWKKPK